MKKYVVAVHNYKWGDTYKEFDDKKDAIRYRMECNCDLNTYAWLYKYVEVTEEMEDKVFDRRGKKQKLKQKSELEILEEKLNKAHTEFLQFKPKQKGYKEAREKYLQLSEEYSKAYKKSLKD